ncbi:efflux RND transporter periplasmic adaptor subunit [Limimaricola litoreus]|nr:HlyD family efflux transporter periplasmic adaptor subunit [Limimaricola litoreus]
MTRRNRLILLLGLAGLALATLTWVAVRPVPVTADLAQVTRGPMEVTVEVDGEARVRETWEVSSPFTGTAMRSPVRVGDPVVQGETIVAVVQPIAPGLLDRRSRLQAEAAVHEAEAGLAAAESRVQQALQDLAYGKSQFDRAQALVERGVATSVRLEDAAQALKLREAARDAAISARALAQSSLERAKAALVGPDEDEDDASACCVEIRAPASGVVMAIDRRSEGPVTTGERLLSIGDPNDLEIVADLLSRDAVRIPEGAPARVDRWGGAGGLDARLRRIVPLAHTVVSSLGIEEQRVEAIFDLAEPLPEGARLGDGYAVRLAIIYWQAPNVLQVPVGALFRDGPGWAVFALRDGRAARMGVEIGQRNDRVAQVLEGPAEGDVVVVHPGEKVSQGVSIEEALRE